MEIVFLVNGKSSKTNKTSNLKNFDLPEAHFIKDISKKDDSCICRNDNYFLRSIYFWWWTPSTLKPELIWKIIKTVEANNYLPLLGDKTEILLECNPQNISEENLKKWKEIWINKISIWIQTFQNKFFSFIERDIENLEEKILLAKKYFPNLSMDLIFWYPDQSLEDLKKDLEIVKKLDIEHLSFYALDYKPNSKIEKIKWKALPFKKVQEFYNLIYKELENQWFEHYETYNFAKKWNYSVHNLDFWNWNDYLWFWLSAVWTIWNKVFENTKNLKKYLSKVNFKEVTDLNDFEKNYLLLQRWFRLFSWIDEEIVKKLVDESVFEKIKNSDFTIFRNWKISLKQEKMMLFNDFFEEIFS